MAKILIMSADGFEDLELFYPFYRLKEEGYDVVVASVEKGYITGKHGYKAEARLSFKDVRPEEYVGLVLPGGRAPERVRLDWHAIEIVKHFFKEGKPVAAICHGPQVLISARVLEERMLTSWYGIKDDVVIAGGLWADEPVVVDENLVTSRHPGDLADWMREYIKMLKSKYPP